MNNLIDFFSLNQWQYFHFLRPYWLLAFIIMYFILRIFGQRDDTLTIWRKVMSTDMLNTLTVQGNTGNWLSPQKLSLIISLPLCIILMGPTWQQQPSPFSENNAPLIIALDVSSTMEQNDIQPNRLLRAKQKILQLLALRGDTKTALIAYAGSAHIVMPLTNDRKMIQHFLDSLSKKLIPVKGKSPENILPIAAKLLPPSNIAGTLLVIGDGASKQSTAAFEQYFQNEGELQNNQLIVWAIGKPLNELSSDSNIIPLQLEQLELLVDNTNGRLVKMTMDEEDISNVNRYIEHNLVVVDDESRPWHDSGYPLVFVIALLYLFWFRRGWTLQW
jgi:Ca-activated chloride channel family protein